MVEWIKPRRPEWMSPAQYAPLPATMPLRELRCQIVRPGYRTLTLFVATTLLDPNDYPLTQVADLYRLRWDAEINLRSLKIAMNMDILRGLTPDIVQKEIWAHLLAYNLIRTVIMQAAQKHGQLPRHLSFKRALRTLEAFRPTIALIAQTAPEKLPQLYHQLLDAIAHHEIANRPHRLEPRQRKRRPKPYQLMTQPRHLARTQEANKR